MRNRKLACCLSVVVGVLGISLLSAQPIPASHSKTRTGLANEESAASKKPVPALSDADKNFIKQAAIGDLAEVQLGQMAQHKAADPKVKQFAGRMVQDHSSNADLMTSLSQTQHVPLPTQLDAAHKSAMDKLSRESGPQFDKDYMRLMVVDHTQTLAKFKQEAAASNDATLKSFAQGTVPTLESHLQEAERIDSQIAAGKK